VSKLRAVEKVIRKAIPIVADHTGSPDPFQKPLPAGSRPERSERQGRPQGKPQGRPARSGNAPQRAGGKPAGGHHEAGRAEERNQQPRRRRRGNGGGAARAA
jgi:ATP-dependent RNA helicase RhlE